MQFKGRTGAAVVTVEEVDEALARTQALSSEEEKVVRMRQGVRSGNLRAPLPRAAGRNTEVADELLLIEMQLQKAFRMRLAQPASSRETTADVDAQSKEKIIRALRRKR